MHLQKACIFAARPRRSAFICYKIKPCYTSRKRMNNMQTIMDAASHIAEEIERTRLHLANLEQALEGLKPLLTIDVSSTTLTYSQVNETQPVEDAFIVQKAKPKAKAAKPRKAQPVQPETAATTAGTPVGDKKPKVSLKPKAGIAGQETPADTSPAKAEPKTEPEVTPKAKAKAKVKVPSEPKPAAPAVKPAGIPSTGAAFWMKSVGRKAFSSSELTQTALEKLSLDASAKDVMANRARAWITSALKKGVLLTTGMRNGVNFYKLA